MPDTAPTRKRALQLLACLVVLGACDDPGTVPLAPPAALRPALLPGTALGSFQVPVPPGNEVADGSLPWTSTGITVPEGVVAKVVVEGVVTLAENTDPATSWRNLCTYQAPAQRPPYCGASPPWAGQAVGPLGNEEGLGVQVGVRRPDGRTDGPSYLAPGARPSSAEGVVSGPGEIVVRRGGISFGVYLRAVRNDDVVVFDGRVWTYVFSGLQTLSATVISDGRPDGCPAPGVRLTLSGAGARGCEEPTAALVLECRGRDGAGGVDTVLRGERIRCVARKEPETASGALRVAGWSFEGRERTDGDPASAAWEGVMVRGGTVTVRGSIGGGAPQTASVVVVVRARDWSGKKPVIIPREVGNGEDPRMETILPAVPAWAHELGYTSFFARPSPDALPEDPTVEVVGGPNDGLYYFGDPEFRVYALYVLNRAAMQAGSEFAQKQEPPGTGSGRIGGINWCSRSVVPRLLELVQAHEFKHIETYGEAYGRELAERLAELEEMASDNASDLTSAFDDVFPSIHPAALSASKRIHERAGNPFRTTPSDEQGLCVLRNANNDQLRNEEER